MVVSYLALIELGKRWFYRSYGTRAATPLPWHRAPGHRLRRRAARFASHTTRRGAGQAAVSRQLSVGTAPDVPIAPTMGTAATDRE